MHTVDTDALHTEPAPPQNTHGYLPRQLVMLGAGHAHVQVLAHLAAHPLVGARVILVTPHPRQLYSGMVPGFMAGHYALEDCVIPLEPLVRRAGVRWLHRSVKALDADSATVLLDDGSTLNYDWLSVNTGPVQNRALMERDLPGAREHGLFVRPIETLGALWPQVLALGTQKALRIAVIGAGATGVELAMAVRHRLPNAAVTLLAGTVPVGAAYSAPVQQRLVAALKARQITVLQDVALGLNGQVVRLGCGADLACDVPLIATGAQPAPWLAGSGLAVDAHGFIAVDACQRSTSHAQVFAVGDISTRTDRPLARSGVYAVRAGPALARNLAAAVAGTPPTPHQPPKNTLNLLSCGGRYAIASWGNWSAQGRWWWWLKDRIDRQFIARFTR
jgi:pyridine nucleotide-disulfide oxidoreductase family protein